MTTCTCKSEPKAWCRVHHPEQYRCTCVAPLATVYDQDPNCPTHGGSIEVPKRQDQTIDHGEQHDGPTVLGDHASQRDGVFFERTTSADTSAVRSSLSPAGWCVRCRGGRHDACTGLDGDMTTHPDSLPLCTCTHGGAR